MLDSCEVVFQGLTLLGFIEIYTRGRKNKRKCKTKWRRKYRVYLRQTPGEISSAHSILETAAAGVKFGSR